MVRALAQLDESLRSIEGRLDDLERNIRLMGPQQAEDRAAVKQVLMQGVRDELADILAELKATRQMSRTRGSGPAERPAEGGGAGMDSLGEKILGLDGNGAGPSGGAPVGQGGGEVPADGARGLEDDTVLGQIVEKLDSAREARESIYDFIFRLLIKQEINSARTKLLFLVQRYDVELSLFDELDTMEVSVNNTFINTEELNLRWKIFEERVKSEIERLRSD